MNNNNFSSIKIVNYSLLSLIIIEYSVILYDIFDDKSIERRDLYFEILGFIALSLLLYNYYNFLYIKEIFIILLIFIIVRLFIFAYILSKFDIENYFSSNNIKAIAE
jgi:hypothetical protein